jgi:hypothetical protein
MGDDYLLRPAVRLDGVGDCAPEKEGDGWHLTRIE